MPLITYPEFLLNNLLQQYNDNISEVINKHAPLRTKTITVRPPVPWYNDDIQQEKLLRRKAESKWRKTGLEIHKQIYCHHRNRTNYLVKIAKIESYNTKIADCGSDQKALFKVVNQLLGVKKDLTLPSNDSLLDTLNKFNAFFSTKILNIRKKLDAENNICHRENSVLPLPESKSHTSLEHFDELSKEEIKKLISASPTKTCNLDPIPTWLLKDNIDIFVPAITSIVNRSLAVLYHLE
jgi:hypothetical protein